MPADYVPYDTVQIDDGLGASQTRDGVFPRTVKHVMGSTTIPAQPRRVVVISGGQLDAVLSLGVLPVGATNARAADLIPDYIPQAVPSLAGRLKTISSVGQRTEPNIERIAALHPDLILGNKSGLEDIYPQLSRIAPTVFTVGAPPKWREDYLLLASALGRQQQAEKVLRGLSEQAGEIASSISGDLPVVSLVRIQADRVRAMGTGATAGMVMAEVGFRRPTIAPGDDLSADLSTEEINKVDGDLLFYGALGTGASSPVDAGPLWKTLHAVRTGKAYGVDDAVWFQNAGPLATKTIMTQLRDHLTQT